MSRRPGFGRRFATTLMAAALGAYGGFLYCQQALPDGDGRDALQGLYASAGAAFAVLGFRVASIALALWRDGR